MPSHPARAGSNPEFAATSIGTVARWRPSAATQSQGREGKLPTDRRSSPDRRGALAGCTLNPAIVPQKGGQPLGRNVLIISGRKCKGHLRSTFPIEAGQRRPQEHQEQARHPANRDLGFGAELTFDFLTNSLALPTPYRSIGKLQQLVLVISTEARLALSGTPRVLEQSSEFAPCSPGSRGGAVVLRNSNRVRWLRANCYRLYRRWTERHRNRLRT